MIEAWAPATTGTATQQERAYAHALLFEARRRAGCHYRTYFPDCLPACKKRSTSPDDHVVRLGFERPTCRVLYPRSVMFFAGGKIHKERLFLAANRVSKTVSAAYEKTAHLTGDYPTWWSGRRFTGPIEAWAAGDTMETTRDIVQLELCGSRDAVRSGQMNGMIPAHLIQDRTLKSGGVADCVGTVWVRWGQDTHHGAPLVSQLEFKAYQQGRLSFQGTSKHVIWLDEEPPDASETPSGGGTPSGNGDIYTECLLRTATTDGIIMATFTPLRGLTPFVDGYLTSAVMCDAEGRVMNAKVGLFGDQAA